MKTSIHSGIFHRDPLTKVIPGLAKIGFDAIELNAELADWTKPHVSPDMNRKTLADIRRVTQDNGMGISAISAHRSMIFSDAAERQASVNYVKGCIDAAPQVGTNIVHILSGPYAQGASNDQSWQWMLDSIRACARHAAEQNVTLAIEAVGFSVVADMKDLQRCLDDLKEYDVCINLDTAHLPVADEDPPEWIRTFGPRVVHIHIKDARIYNDTEERVAVFGVTLDFECPPLGRGIIDWPPIIEALQGVGYDGYLSVEHSAHIFGYNQEPWDRYEVAGECYVFLKDLLAATAGSSIVPNGD